MTGDVIALPGGVMPAALRHQSLSAALAGVANLHPGRGGPPAFYLYLRVVSGVPDITV